MTGGPAPALRLHLWFASRAPRAVILRQGPARLFRMILWHTDTDRFEDGQWLRAKIYAERCALSPDGRHFLYFALDGRRQGPTGGSYTAISRPPWFTALALFPVGGTWHGGGGWTDAHRYHADGGADLIGKADGLVRVPRPPEHPDAPLRHGPAHGPVWQPPEPPAPGSAAALAGTVWADGPRLWRLDGDEPALIRDLSGMRFSRIEPPHV